MEGFEKLRIERAGVRRERVSLSDITAGVESGSLPIPGQGTERQLIERARLEEAAAAPIREGIENGGVGNAGAENARVEREEGVRRSLRDNIDRHLRERRLERDEIERERLELLGIWREGLERDPVIGDIIRLRREKIFKVKEGFERHRLLEREGEFCRRDWKPSRYLSGKSVIINVRFVLELTY
jgi:hypothetical protein